MPEMNPVSLTLIPPTSSPCFCLLPCPGEAFPAREGLRKGRQEGFREGTWDRAGLPSGILQGLPLSDRDRDSGNRYGDRQRQTETAGLRKRGRQRDRATDRAGRETGDGQRQRQRHREKQRQGHTRRPVQGGTGRHRGRDRGRDKGRGSAGLF